MVVQFDRYLLALPLLALMHGIRSAVWLFATVLLFDFMLLFACIYISIHTYLCMYVKYLIFVYKSVSFYLCVCVWKYIMKLCRKPNKLQKYIN